MDIPDDDTNGIITHLPIPIMPSQGHSIGITRFKIDITHIPKNEIQIGQMLIAYFFLMTESVAAMTFIELFNAITHKYIDIDKFAGFHSRFYNLESNIGYADCDFFTGQTNGIFVNFIKIRRDENNWIDDCGCYDSSYGNRGRGRGRGESRGRHNHNHNHNHTDSKIKRKTCKKPITECKKSMPFIRSLKDDICKILHMLDILVKHPNCSHKNRYIGTIHDMVPILNKTANILRSVGFQNIPSINTKSHTSHGLVHKMLETHMDTINIEQNEPDAKLLSLCSSGKSTHKPCLIVRADMIAQMINTYINEPKNWILNMDKYMKAQDEHGKSYNVMNHKPVLVNMQLSKSLSLKCPSIYQYQGQKQGQNQFNKECCNRPIKLRNMLAAVPKDMRAQRDQVDINNVRSLANKLAVLYANEHSDKYRVLKCITPGCVGFDGFIEPVNHSQLEPNAYNKNDVCMHCGKQHDKFYHRFHCIFCKWSFCDVCKMSPYHENFQVCKGPVPDDMTPEEYAKMIKVATRCHNCKKWVTKSEGCNHMTCICGYDFCYLCGGKMDIHSYPMRCLNLSCSWNLSDGYDF